jgi:hypothetical protein
LGAAFKLNDRLVLRGGYGEYFWPMPLSQILQTSRIQPPLNLRYTNEPSNFDNSGTYTLRTLPTSQFFNPNATVLVQGIVPLPATARDGFLWDGRNWKDGRSQTWHLTLEHEVLKNTALRLSYIGNHGSDLEQRAAINNLEAQFNYVSRTGLAPATGLAGDIQRRINPNWSFGNGLLNRTGFSNSHSAQVELERRYSSGYGFQLFYVFNHTLTTTDAGGFTSGNAGINDRTNGLRVPQRTDIFGEPSLSYDQLLRLAYSNSTNIPAHHVRYNGIVDLPFGKGKKFGGGSKGVVNQVIGGWQVATIGEWRGGFWNGLPSSLWIFSDPILQPDQRVEFIRNGVRQRLWFKGDFDPRTATNVTGGDLAALVPVDRSQRAVHPLGPAFDNRLPQLLANGTIRNTSITDLYNPTPRGFIVGPGFWNADISLFKWFDITETVKLRVTADFFNAFNHPVDVDPNYTLGTQDLYRQANEPRIVQFSLRLNW